MAIAIITGFVILWLALAAWVYFDATERGKPSIVWAGAVFFLPWVGLIALILYLIFRDTGQRNLVPPGGGRRQYLYIVSFAGLATLMLGLTVLVTTTIVRAISTEALDDDGYRNALAGSLAAIVVGAAFWASHWFRAERRLSSIASDQDFRATFYLHRAYVYTVFGLSWIIVFVASLWLLGGGLSDILGVEGMELEGWLPALGPLVIALLVVGFHYVTAFETPRYKEWLARFESIPAPPVIGAPPAEAAPAYAPAVVAAAAPSPPAAPAPSAPPPPAPARHFCTRCGAPAGLQDTFCGSCGAALPAA